MYMPGLIFLQGLYKKWDTLERWNAYIIIIYTCTCSHIHVHTWINILRKFIKRRIHLSRHHF